ncbi:MAG TPA: cytochrome c oxidase subunit II [Sphingomonadaceae bacterium]|nr:cytochrome c oxidase subunit II [Sphingomonadaceae bacterium]
MKLLPLLLAAMLAAVPGAVGAQSTSSATTTGTASGGSQPVMTQPATTNPVATNGGATPAAAAPQSDQPTIIPGVEPTGPAAAQAQGPAAQPAAQPAVAVPTLPVIPPFKNVGLPDGRMGLQDQVTDIGRDAAYFHDIWLIPIITAISLLVLILLAWVIVRYRRSANPVPSRTSHNTTIEVIWTVVPVLALVAIAFPSLGLLARQYAPPKADITVKVIGNQWYWTYQYPDHGGFELVSNMLKEQNEVTAGQRFRKTEDGPRLLAVDERMVVPVNSTVKVIVTSADVMHAFAMPAFWQKMDAVPGRLNETWFNADREGVYFGQCSELCGARHAYMPIAIEVVSPARFAAWVASKGGTMPGAAPPNADATATSPITNPTAGTSNATVAAGDALETSPAPNGVVDAVETPVVSTQGATDSRRSNQDQ